MGTQIVFYASDQIKAALFPLMFGEMAKLALRKAGLREELFHHDLIHPGRRCQHARPDVRDIRHFEQPLDGAVLAERSVKERKHQIHGRISAVQSAENRAKRRFGAFPAFLQLQLFHLVERSGQRGSLFPFPCFVM